MPVRTCVTIPSETGLAEGSQSDRNSVSALLHPRADTFALVAAPSGAATVSGELMDDELLDLLLQMEVRLRKLEKNSHPPQEMVPASEIMKMVESL